MILILFNNRLSTEVKHLQSFNVQFYFNLLISLFIKSLVYQNKVGGIPNLFKHELILECPGLDYYEDDKRSSFCLLHKTSS